MVYNFIEVIYMAKIENGYARMNFKLPEDLYKNISDVADELCINKSALVIMVLKDFINTRSNAKDIMNNPEKLGGLLKALGVSADISNIE